MTTGKRKVRVYYNLHKHCYSVQDYATGKVIAHVPSIHLSDVSFVVRKAGRAKVLREKRKNVHAFVVGFWKKTACRKCKTRVRYNPYISDSFFTDNGPVTSSKSAALTDKGVFI